MYGLGISPNPLHRLQIGIKKVRVPGYPITPLPGLHVLEIIKQVFYSLERLEAIIGPAGFDQGFPAVFVRKEYKEQYHDGDQDETRNDIPSGIVSGHKRIGKVPESRV